MMTGTTASFATDCQDWFRSLKLNPSEPNCKSLCEMAGTDMGTFTCPELCATLCKPQEKTKDVLRYYPTLAELCDQEISLIKTFPDEALRIRKAKQTALEETRVRFGGNFRDDESDAFRHCFWPGLISTNESCSNDSPGTSMDNFNNREGIQLAEKLSNDGLLTKQALADACSAAIDSKSLKVIHPLGGKK